MKIYNITLQIKEKGTKNKIKIKSKLNQEGIDNLIASTILEILDFPRKKLIEALKMVKIKNKII